MYDDANLKTSVEEMDCYGPSHVPSRELAQNEASRSQRTSPHHWEGFTLEEGPRSPGEWAPDVADDAHMSGGAVSTEKQQDAPAGSLRYTGGAESVPKDTSAHRALCQDLCERIFSVCRRLLSEHIYEEYANVIVPAVLCFFA